MAPRLKQPPTGPELEALLPPRHGSVLPLEGFVAAVLRRHQVHDALTRAAVTTCARCLEPAVRLRARAAMREQHLPKEEHRGGNACARRGAIVTQYGRLKNWYASNSTISMANHRALEARCSGWLSRSQ